MNKQLALNQYEANLCSVFFDEEKIEIERVLAKNRTTARALAKSFNVGEQSRVAFFGPGIELTSQYFDQIGIKISFKNETWQPFIITDCNSMTNYSFCLNVCCFFLLFFCCLVFSS